MKKLVSKASLLLLCGLFSLASCNTEKKPTEPGTDPETGKVTVTESYQILASADVKNNVPDTKDGLAALNVYIKAEMKAVSDKHEVASWKITETADTKEAAIALCDKKALEAFTADKVAAITAACSDVKDRFEAKRKELSAEILKEDKKYQLSFKEYGAHLVRYNLEDGSKVVKSGATLVNFEAIGGTEY